MLQLDIGSYKSKPKSDNIGLDKTNRMPLICYQKCQKNIFITQTYVGCRISYDTKGRKLIIKTWCC